MMTNVNGDSSGEKVLDVSVNPFCWALVCPCSFGAIPYRETLILGHDELTVIETSLCGESESKITYGEIGSVDRNSCLCWKSASSNFGSLSPGWGCNEERVDEIVDELRKRIRERGDAAQLYRTEQTLNRLDEMEKKIDMIMEAVKIPAGEKMKDRE